MNFETYLNQSWNDHPTQAEKIAQEFSFGASLIKTNEELDQFVNLATHIMGEHLARWKEGVSYLGELKKHSAFASGTEVEKSMERSCRALEIGGGEHPDLNSFSLSDQIRIFAMASSALCEKDSHRSQDLLRQALKLSEHGLDRKDPAHRALAVTGNNVACSLEEKVNRSKDETDLMILAAETARRHWELCRTMTHVARAEYRLAMTFLQAEIFERSIQHAQTCVQLGQDHNLGSVDLFFAFEALALGKKKQGDLRGFQKAFDEACQHFERLSEEERKWCEPSLAKLKSFIGSSF